MTLIKALVLPDVHAPYHDVRAWSLAMQCGRALFDGTAKNNRRVASVGDFVDCCAISRFPKRNRMPFEQEIESGRALLDDVRSLGAVENIFIEGNHEDRWPIYLATHAPEATGLFPSMRELLGLQDFTYVKYHDSYVLGDLELTHDTGSYGSTAHKQAMAEAGGKIAIGHTHWAGIEFRSRRDRSTYFGAALGCLADKRKVDYQTRIKTTNWTLGVGLAYIVDGLTHLQYCPFLGQGKNLHAIVEGRVVRPNVRGI